MKHIYKALMKAQSEFPAIKKSATNPAFQRNGKGGKYTTLDALIDATIKTLHKNGLVVFQTMRPTDDGLKVNIVTILAHAESGESIESELTLPLDKNNPQGVGSAITYGRRYGYAAILGVTSDDDDDGNRASNEPHQGAQLPATPPPASRPQPNHAGKPAPQEIVFTAFGYRPKTWPPDAHFKEPAEPHLKKQLDKALGNAGLSFEHMDAILEAYASTCPLLDSEESFNSKGAYTITGQWVQHAPKAAQDLMREYVFTKGSMENKG